ncbi:MAG: T9SS type A sorting domain-containing protein [Bacteroidia bacterium]
MTKQLLTATLLIIAFVFNTKAQDTLKRWDLFGEGVQALPETQTQPNPWGYRYGHGANGVYEFAEKYAVSEEQYLLGVVVLLDDFMGGANTTDECWAALYSPTETGAVKGNSDQKVTMPINELSLGMATPAIFMFPNGTTVKDSFFVSFGFPKYDFNVSSPNYTPTEDTLGIYVTYSRAGDNDADVFWKNAIRYNGGNWEPTEFIKGDRVNFCIAPIVSTEDPSSITKYNFGGAISISSVYPNPVIETINFDIESEKAENANISIYDLNGKVISSQQYDLQTGKQTVSIDLPTSVPSGQFLALVKTTTGMVSFMLVKE